MPPPKLQQNVGKSKFLSRQTGYYNFLAEQKDEKIHVFQELIFLKTYFFANLKNFSWSAIFIWYTFEKSSIVKSNFFYKSICETIVRLICVYNSAKAPSQVF